MHSFLVSLQSLFGSGLLVNSFIDIGAADGHLFLDISKRMSRPTPTLLIDANPLYEPSLRAVSALTKGSYRIAAVGEAPGRVSFAMSVHPYWSRLDAPEDATSHPFSEKMEMVEVPMITIDATIAETKLPPPYLMKLDVEGGELAALKGALSTLALTDIVVCETHMPRFHEIYRFLTDNGFFLYDVTGGNYNRHGHLQWFHPVFVSKRWEHLQLIDTFAEVAKVNAQGLIQAQIERREAILQAIRNEVAAHNRATGATIAPP